jgi:hypothetical protein
MERSKFEPRLAAIPRICVIRGTSYTPQGLYPGDQRKAFSTGNLGPCFKGGGVDLEPMAVIANAGVTLFEWILC